MADTRHNIPHISHGHTNQVGTVLIVIAILLGGLIYTEPAAGKTVPAPLNAVNTPLKLLPNQSGKLAYTFSDGSAVAIHIPSGASATTVTYTIAEESLNPHTTPPDSFGASLVNDTVYNIIAVDENGNRVKNLTDDSTVTFTIPNMPKNAIVAYYFDNTTNTWVLLPSRLSGNTVSILSTHLTLFGIFRVITDHETISNTPVRVLGLSTYADGTLLRNAQGNIYVITDTTKYHIRTLQELASNYSGMTIFDVDDDVLARYREIGTLVVKGITHYADGTLLKGSDNKIYVIKHAKKVHIKTLEELRNNYFGVKIITIDDSVLAQY